MHEKQSCPLCDPDYDYLHGASLPLNIVGMNNVSAEKWREEIARDKAIVAIRACLSRVAAKIGLLADSQKDFLNLWKTFTDEFDAELNNVYGRWDNPV